MYPPAPTWNALAISIMAVLLATIVSPAHTEERQSSVTVYTSPEINLGEIDREIIDQKFKLMWDRPTNANFNYP